MSVLTFGKHKGSDISSVPSEYLEWGANKLESPKWRKEFEAELIRRNKEQKEKELYIKANIDSQEVWDLLVKEAEKELYEEEDFSLENDCQYDGRLITQKEIDDLAKEKLAKYKAEEELSRIEVEILKVLGCDKNMLSRIESAYWNDELSQKNFAQKEKFEAAVAYCEKKSNLLSQIHSC